MTEAMPFLQNYDITFLRPPPFAEGAFYCAITVPHIRKNTARNSKICKD